MIVGPLMLRMDGLEKTSKALFLPWKFQTQLIS